MPTAKTPDEQPAEPPAEDDTEEARAKRGGPSSHDTAGQFPHEDVRATDETDTGGTSAPADQ